MWTKFKVNLTTSQVNEVLGDLTTSFVIKFHEKLSRCWLAVKLRLRTRNFPYCIKCFLIKSTFIIDFIEHLWNFIVTITTYRSLFRLHIFSKPIYPVGLLQPTPREHQSAGQPSTERPTTTDCRRMRKLPTTLTRLLTQPQSEYSPCSGGACSRPSRNSTDDSGTWRPTCRTSQSQLAEVIPCYFS